MILVIVAAPVPSAVADPSDDHVHLAGAATWALTTSNVDLLKALLQAGLQINEPLEDELGWTLLHYAAGSGTERVVRFLVDNGAEPSCRDHGGKRPIDIAYHARRTNICEILSETRKTSYVVDGFPGEVLEWVFRPNRLDAVHVSVNGTDPSGELMEWIRGVWPNAAPGSKGEFVEDEASGEKSYRDIESKEKMAKCDVTMEMVGEREYSWSISYRTGPLAGFFDVGRSREEYGYWLVTESKGGEL